MHLFRTITQNLFILCLSLCAVSTAYASMRTAGGNEIIVILPEGIELDTKLDTGAKNSSLDARKIELFKKDGKDWVRFEVTRGLNDKIVTLEYPQKRSALIISRVQAESNKTINDKPVHKRPVIEMLVCIGSVQKVIEVNLTDRSNFAYPFLLGETALAEFDLLVDVQKDYILDKKCKTD